MEKERKYQVILASMTAVDCILATIAMFISAPVGIAGWALTLLNVYIFGK